MFTIDEIIKLKNEGFTTDDIVELAKMKSSEPKIEEVKKEPKVEETKEEPKVEETKEDTKVEETKEDTELKELNPINELNSFNDKIDDLINQIKLNNISKQYIETPEEMSATDILANVINPFTKGVINNGSK